MRPIWNLKWIITALGICVSIIMYILLILIISAKIYYLIYSNYTLGLLFPYPSYRIIIVVVAIAMSLVLFCLLRLIARLIKAFH